MMEGEGRGHWHASLLTDQQLAPSAVLDRHVAPGVSASPTVSAAVLRDRASAMGAVSKSTGFFSILRAPLACG